MKTRAFKTIVPNESGEPPSEFLLIALGSTDTLNGTYSLTAASAAECMKAWADYGNKLHLDYNHAVLNENPSPDDLIAAAWFNLELRADGIWAVDLEWTPKATEHLKAGEYKYFSPFIVLNAANECIEVINAALTNYPATKNMQAFAREFARDMRPRQIGAYSINFMQIEQQLKQLLRKQFTTPDMWLWICELYNDYCVFEIENNPKLYRVNYTLIGNSVTLNGDAFEVVKTYVPVSGGETMKTVLQALSLNPDATEAQALERVTALSGNLSGLQREMLSLTGETDTSKALGVLAAYKASHANAAALQAKLDAVETERKTEKLSALVAKGKADGKLTPAMEPWALSRNPDELEAFLAVAPRAIAPVGSDHQEPDPSNSSPTTGAALLHLGKTWQALNGAERAALSRGNPEHYAAMRNQAIQIGVLRQ